jgi:hypothetical protein
MDFILYSDKLTSPSKFPSVTASTSAPKTLYHAAHDLVYVNTGSGWQPMLQPNTASVYSAYSSAAASTQANILSSVANTSSAPHAAHVSVATKAADIAIRGR